MEIVLTSRAAFGLTCIFVLTFSSFKARVHEITL